MDIRIGINGFGRIGRNAARIITDTKELTLAAINSNSDVSSHAYLLKHDSVYGTLKHSVVTKDNTLIVDGTSILCFQEKEPKLIPWNKAGVDLVLECSGKFTTKETAGAHLGNSVKHVVISAPVKDNTPTYVMGVNHEDYKKESVISNSSCTTNCVTTVLSVLQKEFGVKRGSMTTVHAATDSQNLLDNSMKKGVRDRRSALTNCIPASSGSARDVAKFFPHLTGKLPCRAIRVPTPTVSLIELVVEVSKSTDLDTVNQAFRRAKDSTLKGILSVADEELVSTDYVGSSYSSIVDPFLTDVIDTTLIHVTAWYDNEWGYANRLVELASLISHE